jgi:similar to stage IV sporulation protein
MEATCSISKGDLKKLKKSAKSLYKITVISEQGVAYQTKQLINAPEKIIAIILAIILVAGQSFFVKDIEVNGYKSIPETELRKVLEEAGIKEWSYIPNINWIDAEESLYDIFPQITWLQLVYDGRKVFLNIAESDGTGIEEMTEYLSSSKSERTYCNIVAAESGYIESISTYRGLALVEAGEYVEAGQVLISGYVPIEPTVYDEDAATSYLVWAKGEVMATVPFRLTFNQERYTTETANEESDIVENKREKTEEEIKDKVNQQIRMWAEKTLPENSQILNKDLNFTTKENIIEVSVTLEVRYQIGIEQEILIGEEASDSSGR